MPKRIPLGAIGVTRDGKTFYPAIGTATTGEAFDFTAEELAEIAKLEKASGTPLVRKLIVEESPAPAPTAPTAPTGGAETKVVMTMANKRDEIADYAEKIGVEVVAADTKETLLAKISDKEAELAAGEEDL